MAEARPGNISQITISRGLKKLGFTRKKRPMVMRFSYKTGEAY